MPAAELKALADRGESRLTPDDKITVSKMAEIHKISRQTLIFYDKINLFRPALVE